MRLNGLLASPAFAAWSAGPPLDVDTLLRDRNRPRAAIMSVAHLSDEERQFVVTATLAKVVTWMRRQPGTDQLRALIYFDEVMGYVPPVSNPPAKQPILTLMKQARAFGVGLVLATQNPVDVDYKGISNAGTWMIGRLQTEQDKARLLDGLEAASGAGDLQETSATISGLEKREFVLRQAGRDELDVFTTRWAMSYLRGPLTRDQISALMEASRPPATPAATDPASSVYSAAVAARVELLFDDERASLRHSEQWEAVIHPVADTIDAAAAVAVDYDDRDFTTEAPTGSTFVLPDEPIAEKRYFTELERALIDHLDRKRTKTIYCNPKLKLYSRVDESQEQFAVRCDQAGQAAADEAAAKLRDKVESRLATARQALGVAQDRYEQAAAEAEARRSDELVRGAGSLLDVFLGGRRSLRKISTALGGAGSRRGRSGAAYERVEAAQHRVADKRSALHQLEADLATDLLELDAEFQQKAAAIETVEIPLEKSDVRVSDVAVVWIPVGRGGASPASGR